MSNSIREKAERYAERFGIQTVSGEKDVMLAENFWTRFLRVYDRCRELIAAGGIGELCLSTSRTTGTGSNTSRHP